MIVKEIEKLENEYYGNNDSMTIPDLLCNYYEDREYELVCYLSNMHMVEFGESEFYHMMSLMELGYYGRAIAVYKKHQGDWYQIFRQLHIYWKHVVLFALYFRDLDLTEYYMDLLGEYYDSRLVQLLDYMIENKNTDIRKNVIFQNLVQTYPVLSFTWAKAEDKKRRSLITFEDMAWDIWDRENQKLGNGKRFGMEKVYEDEDVEIYSYKPKQVAASMHIIRDGHTVIMLDCGCEIHGEEMSRIAVQDILSGLGIETVDAVFISHAHMDHYGSMNEIRKYHTFMTRETMQLIRCVSPETFLGNTDTVNLYEEKTVGGVSVKFIPNGHIRGSVLMDINWNNKKRIVYTGDFSVEDQQTVKGFDMNDLCGVGSKRINVLLTETTYGNKPDMFSLKQYEKIFVTLCEKYLRYGNKIFIPCFAIGRAQEAALLLSECAKTNGWRILIDGMAGRVTECYQSFMGDNEKILNKNITVCYSDLEYGEKIENNEIILASSGMLRPGSTSAKYISNLIMRKKVCVMKIGFIHESEHLLQSVINRKHKNLHYVDLSLSAHAGYDDLIRVLDRLLPDHVIYVHGAGIV